MTLNFRKRTGATLVELLVVMAIIAALSALALMMLPAAANSDIVLKGTNEAQGTLKIAQGMAQAARMPRGVRFIVRGGSQISTEMQYLESPPVMVGDLQTLVGKSGDPYGTNTPNGPRVEILQELAGPPGPTGGPTQGTVTGRHCYIVGLNSDQETQVSEGAVLVMPVLQAWSRINSFTVIPANGPTPRMLEVVLDVYPDAALGTAPSYRTYHFGIYGAPVPLLAEATLPMPRDTAIDLSMSYPPGQPGQNYDVLFAPNGQTLSTGGTTGTYIAANTNIFLWVRDITKPAMTPLSRPTPATPTAPWSFNPALDQFRTGGEQQIIGVRNGFIGTAPVNWPNNLGTYTGNQDPYTLARNKLN